MRRAIVTGAQGFVGRHLVQDLRQRGVHVTTLGRKTAEDLWHIAMGDGPWGEANLARVIDAAEPDAIFHLAGGAVGSAAELEYMNVTLANSLFGAVRDVGARPLLVMFGSAAEYGGALLDGVPICETAICAPLNPYATTKLAQTKAALAFAEATGIEVLITRIFNAIGPGMPRHLALGDFAMQIAALRSTHGTLQCGNLHVFRDFIDVDHVVAILWKLAQNPNARGIVNICSEEATELSGLVEQLICVSGKKITIETVPSRMRPGELRVILGSAALLTKLGAPPPQTDYASAVLRVWEAAESRWAGAS
jgi:GDP-4-dehydro-6-deoxy-D-mannose reductase